MAELVGESQDGIAVQSHSVNNHGLFSRSETATESSVIPTEILRAAMPASSENTWRMAPE